MSESKGNKKLGSVGKCGKTSVVRMLLRVVLYPFALLYLFVISMRNLLFDLGLKKIHKVSIPVISVGNISCGGTGKTPFVLWLAHKLQKAGKKPVVLSRGYGRKKGEKYNEESQMLVSAGIDVLCNPDRVAGAKELEDKFDVIILDDGFQHRRLHRDVDIVLIDSTRPPDADSLLPAGFLREPQRSLSRAKHIVFTRTDLVVDTDSAIVSIEKRFPKAVLHRSVFAPEGFLYPDSGEVLELSKLEKKRIGAFCGLGNPSQFFQSVENYGVKLTFRIEFPDHHPYVERDVKRVEDVAEKARVDYIVTSSKDWVKCEPVDRSRKYLIFQVGFQSPSGEELINDIMRMWSQDENTLRAPY